MRELENQIKQIKANKTVAREAIRRPLDSFEVFAQGTRFNHKMALVQGTNIELALMLASLREFSRAPHLGANAVLALERYPHTGMYPSGRKVTIALR